MDLESVDDIDEGQLASWMKQATAIPGFGGKETMSPTPAGKVAPAKG